MSDLEATIRKAMTTDGITSINLFVNADGEFQANTGRQSDRVYAVKRSVDPVKAILAAIKATPTIHKASVAESCSDLGDILG